jgi:Holliday junction resolvase RusA-like endonuclease
MITVWVPGVAKTKGSMVQQQRARGGRLVQSVEGSERWAALVTQATAAALGVRLGLPRAGAVAVRLSFWLPVEDVTAAQSGDVDKLARNVLDALTKAGAYGDDVQVVALVVNKYPARAHPGPGLLLQVWPLGPGQHRDDWALLSLADALRAQHE